MAFQNRLTPGLAAVLVFAVKGTAAHGDVSHIPEGKYLSDDPIVRSGAQAPLLKKCIY